MKKIDHIGVAVKDLDKALSLYRDVLGMEIGGMDEVPAQKVRLAFVPVGDTRLELLEPTQEDSNIAKFIASRGEGVHHIALEVDDIQAALARLKEKGVRLINPEPVPGAHNTRIAFLHPKETNGVLLELVQQPAEGHPG
jgi:methylmalonyl-CoA/ethylmalonyl-CoA epimerase